MKLNKNLKTFKIILKLKCNDKIKNYFNLKGIKLKIFHN